MDLLKRREETEDIPFWQAIRAVEIEAELLDKECI